jgi:hypothetical protein
VKIRLNWMMLGLVIGFAVGGFVGLAFGEWRTFRIMASDVTALAPRTAKCRLEPVWTRYGQVFVALPDLTEK